MTRLALLVLALLAFSLPAAEAGRMPPALRPPADPAPAPLAAEAPAAPASCVESTEGANHVRLCADRVSAPFGEGVLLTANATINGSSAPNGTPLTVWGSTRPSGPVRFTGRCYTYQGGCSFVPVYVTLTPAPVTFGSQVGSAQTFGLVITWH